ncbi:hypothetical protein PR048_008638 [Dryococelus australis]|uniref:PiggyBac transposable element-derived protein 4 C-terminal zinc-ribbon domain-containing protein n=1 Tax=Dryococelus australis TaxID=614101 RepID=A0ABQ9HXP4_9NEOP|nr:hypothetical protein PR048_008638 [Dryococelus australis]
MTSNHKKEEFSPKAPGRPSSSTNSECLTGHHFPISDSYHSKKHSTRLCGMCSCVHDVKGKKARRESQYVCKECDIALSIVPCVRAFHSVRNS